MFDFIGGLLLWLMGSQLNLTPYRLLVMDNQIDRSTNPVVVNYYPDSGKVLIIELPRDLTVEAAGGYGKYQLGSISSLAKMERKGDELNRQTFTKALGINIKKVIKVEAIPYKDGKIDGGKLLSKVGWKSNRQLWWAFVTMPMINIKVSALTSTELGDKELNVDGSLVFLLNEVKTDAKLRRLQQEYVSVNEELTLSIENSTKTSGLAQETKRVMEADGWDVIRLSDGTDELPYTIIIVGDENLIDKPLVKDLALTFPGSEVRTENTESYRSDVVIRLGYRGKGFWD
jgi:hypothetical protein